MSVHDLLRAVAQAARRGLDHDSPHALLPATISIALLAAVVIAVAVTIVIAIADDVVDA